MDIFDNEDEDEFEDEFEDEEDSGVSNSEDENEEEENSEDEDESEEDSGGSDDEYDTENEKEKQEADRRLSRYWAFDSTLLKWKFEKATVITSFTLCHQGAVKRENNWFHARFYEQEDFTADLMDIFTQLQDSGSKTLSDEMYISLKQIRTAMNVHARYHPFNCKETVPLELCMVSITNQQESRRRFRKLPDGRLLDPEILAMVETRFSQEENEMRRQNYLSLAHEALSWEESEDHDDTDNERHPFLPHLMPYVERANVLSCIEYGHRGAVHSDNHWHHVFFGCHNKKFTHELMNIFAQLNDSGSQTLTDEVYASIEKIWNAMKSEIDYYNPNGNYTEVVHSTRILVWARDQQEARRRFRKLPDGRLLDPRILAMVESRFSQEDDETRKPDYLHLAYEAFDMEEPEKEDEN